MQVCVLGSGSSGNCSLVKIGGRVVMIDAGLGPRTVARRLKGRGGFPDRLEALLLTHLDYDHFKPTWLGPLRERGVGLYLHKWHVHDLYRADGHQARALHKAGLLYEFEDQPFGLTAGGEALATIKPTLLSHDKSGVAALRIESPRGRLSFATDIGHVTPGLIRAMTDVDLLAIESNYDPQMQLASDRPATLKRRIMGGKGHLSNEQAFEAVRAAVAGSARPPRHVILLHLSRQCNAPELARQVFCGHPCLCRRLHLSHQDQPTPWLTVGQEPHAEAGLQMELAWA